MDTDLFGGVAVPPPREPRALSKDVRSLAEAGYPADAVAGWSLKKAKAVLARVRKHAARRPLTAAAAWELSPAAEAAAPDPAPLAVAALDAEWLSNVTLDPPADADTLRRVVESALPELGYWDLWQVLLLVEGVAGARAARIAARCRPAAPDDGRGDAGGGDPCGF